MQTFSETISHGMTTDIEALKGRYFSYSEFSGYGELSIERNTDPSLKTADAYRWPVSAVYKPFPLILSKKNTLFRSKRVFVLISESGLYYKIIICFFRLLVFSYFDFGQYGDCAKRATTFGGFNRKKPY